jgi:ADP-heptose:LPS heptosyltransferase/uncharacterized coiled-coil DUF342 family protein
MRILVSNPDTIGDVVLREPMFRALLDAGHELALVVRPLVEPVARVMAPEATIIELPLNVYDGRVEADDERLDTVAESAGAFEPDVFIGAPFTWTVLEERLGSELPDARRLGQAGGKFVDPWHGRDVEGLLPFTEVVRVNEDLHELRKSEALARAALGESVHLPNPRLALPAELRDTADALLSGIGLERGAFLAACVGHHEHTAIRNWALEHWADVLAHWMERYQRPVLLIGAEDEAQAARHVGDMLEARGLEPRHWFGGPEGDTLRLAALLEASRGYVGKDTGPMHIAAALGKPVLAVFGGGTWPRFRPLVSPSVAITLAVPCSPCDWRCDQRRSRCVKDVPVSAVIEQVDRLESGAVDGALVEQIQPSRAALVDIASDAAQAARRYKVELSVMRRTLASTKETHEEQARRNAMSESAVLQRLEKLERVIEQSSQANRQADQRASEVTQKLTQNTQALQQARQELAQAVRRAETADERSARLEQEIQNLRQQLGKATGELEQARTQRDEARARHGELGSQLERMQAERDSAEREAAGLRAKYAGVDLKKLHENLAAARKTLGIVQGEKHDLTLQTQRLLQERRAMEKLADQRLVAIQTLEHKLGELLASRWRQMGQRMRVAMVLPWEEAERKRLLGHTGNGQHAKH